MKNILILAAVAVLAGCGDPGSTVPPKFNAALPAELKDCKIYKLTDGVQSLYITRCPEVTSTTNPGKGGSSVTVNNSAANTQNMVDQASLAAAAAEIIRADAQLADVKARIKAAEDALKASK